MVRWQWPWKLLSQKDAGKCGGNSHTEGSDICDAQPTENGYLQETGWLLWNELKNLQEAKQYKLTKAHTDCDRWFSKGGCRPSRPSLCVCVCVWLFTHLEMFSRFFLNPGWFNEFPWPIRCKKSWWISNWEKRKSERPRQWDMFNLAYYNHRYEKTMSFHTHQRGMFRKPDNSRRRCRCHCWGQ